MSCDEIKVIDGENTIQIINNQDVFDVVDNEDVTKVVNKQTVFEVEDEVKDKVVINATDVLLSSVQTIDIDMICTATEQIGDAVYVFADQEVRQANNTDISKAKVMGFVVSKSGDTACKVRVAGVIDVFTGLSVGNQYFLDSVAGDINITPPTAIGSVLVRTGQAIETDKFLINVNNNYVIRS